MGLTRGFMDNPPIKVRHQTESSGGANKARRNPDSRAKKKPGIPGFCLIRPKEPRPHGHSIYPRAATPCDQRACRVPRPRPSRARRPPRLLGGVDGAAVGVERGHRGNAVLEWHADLLGGVEVLLEARHGPKADHRKRRLMAAYRPCPSELPGGGPRSPGLRMLFRCIYNLPISVAADSKCHPSSISLRPSASSSPTNSLRSPRKKLSNASPTATADW